MALKVQPLRLNLRSWLSSASCYLRANIMGAEFLREPRFEPDQDKHRSFHRLRIDMRLGVLAKVFQHLLCCTGVLCCAKLFEIYVDEIQDYIDYIASYLLKI